MRAIYYTWHIKELVDGLLIDPQYHGEVFNENKFDVNGYDSEDKAIEAIKESPMHVEYIILKYVSHG